MARGRAYSLNPAIEAHTTVVHEIDASFISPIPWYEVWRLEAQGDTGALVDGERWE